MGSCGGLRECTGMFGRKRHGWKGRPQQSVPVRARVQDWDVIHGTPGHCFDPSKGPLDENGAWEGGTGVSTSCL